MAISKRLRYEILRRDGNRCRYCGGSASEVELTVDHVIPTALGGSDDPSNLAAACKDCNAGKSSSAPDAETVADVDAKALTWSKAMASVVEQRAAELEAERKRIARFDKAWRKYSCAGEEIPRDVNWKNSIARFMASGLDDAFLADAVATAMGSPKPSVDEVWRYFCGICWRELDTLRERTAALLDQCDITETRAPQAADERQTACKRCADFDYMAMFDEFLDPLVRAFGGDDQVQKFVNWHLWDAMPQAHKEWRARLQDPGEFDPEDETAEDVALDAAREQMSTEIANAMHELQQWRESRDRSLRVAGGSTDGS